MKQTVFNYSTGFLLNQKHAVRFKMSTSLQCPLCGKPYSALHVLSGCKQSIMSNTVTERHNIANKILLKSVHKSCWACLASMDIGSADHLALHNLQVSEHSTNRTIPKYIPPRRFLISKDSLLVVLMQF
eukprot:1145433-Pelagomonas_calceolata.AAC.4